MFYGGILWSIINTVLLISEHKSDLKKNLIWILISALPILYITIMITIAMTKTID
jgi:choline-glycine betaine transporter